MPLYMDKEGCIESLTQQADARVYATALKTQAQHASTSLAAGSSSRSARLIGWLKRQIKDAGCAIHR